MYQSSIETKNQPSVSTFGTSTTRFVADRQDERYPKSHEKQKRFEDALLDFIIMDSMPFSTVHGVGFNNLITTVDHKLAVPSPRTLGRAMDVKYEKVWSFILDI